MGKVYQLRPNRALLQTMCCVRRQSEIDSSRHAKPLSSTSMAKYVCAYIQYVYYTNAMQGCVIPF